MAFELTEQGSAEQAAPTLGSDAGLRALKHERLRELEREAAGIRQGDASRRMLARDSLYRRALAVSDVVSASGALLVGIDALGTHDMLAPGALVALPLVVVVGKVAGLYDRDQ